ncbi:hypothetical protein [Streptomyces sp. NPDC096105]|uniref:hypothetical protein n=1 Tax=Streptomyces sp. NPDC096105 TaxID=3366074 RepID=UPI00381C9F48
MDDSTLGRHMGKLTLEQEVRLLTGTTTWSQDEHAWAVEPGPHRLMAGRSAGDLRWQGEVTVEPSALHG